MVFKKEKYTMYFQTKFQTKYHRSDYNKLNIIDLITTELLFNVQHIQFV